MRKLRWRVFWEKGEKCFKHYDQAHRFMEALRRAGMNPQVRSIEEDV